MVPDSQSVSCRRPGSDEAGIFAARFGPISKKKSLIISGVSSYVHNAPVVGFITCTIEYDALPLLNISLMLSQNFLESLA